MADTDAELDDGARLRRDSSASRVVLCEVWEKGGAGGEALAREVLALLDRRDRAATRRSTTSRCRCARRSRRSSRSVYGGDGVDYSPAADRAIDYLESIGLHHTPICMAKTQYSLTDDPSRLGRPTGFRITVNEVYRSAGAGFVVAQDRRHHDDAGLAEGAGGRGHVDDSRRRRYRRRMSCEGDGPFSRFARKGGCPLSSATDFGSLSMCVAMPRRQRVSRRRFCAARSQSR